MINSKDIQDITNRLNNCNNVNEMFEELKNKFDLETCKPSSITKPLFVKGIISGIKLLNPKVK
jgi:hypothetical protein